MTMQVDKARLDEMLATADGACSVNIGDWTYKDPTIDFDTMRSIITELLELRSLRSTEGKEAEPEPVWGYGETVGNLIAQLRTLDPAMPIHAGFHADLRGTRQAMVRGLTLSRERVSGRKIDSCNEAVPYSAVIWASPQDALTHLAAEAHVAKLREALEFYRDSWSCKTNKRYGGLEWSPTEALLDDCGNVARAALTRSPE